MDLLPFAQLYAQASEFLHSKFGDKREDVLGPLRNFIDLFHFVLNCRIHMKTNSNFKFSTMIIQFICGLSLSLLVKLIGR